MWSAVRDNTRGRVYAFPHQRNPDSHPPSSRDKNKKPAVDLSQSLAAALGAPVRWYDLPRKLENLISSSTTDRNLLEDVSPGGVTKSWRSQLQNKCKSSPPATLPQLQLFSPSHKVSSPLPHPVPYSTFDIANKQGQVRWVAKKHGAPYRVKPQFLGFSKGMGRTPDRLRYYLLTLEELNYFFWGVLPPWTWDSDHSYPRPKRSSSSRDAVTIVLTGLPLPAFAYYRSGLQWRYAWKKQDSPIVDPNGSEENRFMRLCTGIWFRGKLYAVSLQGTLVVIEQDSNGGFGVGSLGMQRMVPSVPCKHFREIMVESEGEILLIFLIFRKSIGSVDGLEVYRLDIGKLEWVRLHNLGDRVLFFGSNCCVCVSAVEAEKLGCRRNCVYFKHSYSVGWSQYAMAMGIINRLV